MLCAILMWAFGPNRSLVAGPSKPGLPDEYGLLKPVSLPTNYAEAEIMKRTLGGAGIRATIADTLAGPQVMVWPGDEVQAKEVLAKK